MGESVPEGEQSSLNLRDIPAPPTSELPTDSLLSASLALTPPQTRSSTATPTPSEVRAFEDERAKLYQQLDEKVK